MIIKRKLFTYGIVYGLKGLYCLDCNIITEHKINASINTIFNINFYLVCLHYVNNICKLRYIRIIIIIEKLKLKHEIL